MNGEKYQHRWTDEDDRRQAEELRRMRLPQEGEEPADPAPLEPPPAQGRLRRLFRRRRAVNPPER
ncbi:MAG TPA: hypothetical protein VHJ17_11590 [Thermomonospora sp.]|nr:hypothetical protein [Thermomonospora sp.]